MARGRARYQRGRVVATEAGGWEIHYNVYLSDPTTGKAKRHHRRRDHHIWRLDAEFLPSPCAVPPGGTQRAAPTSTTSPVMSIQPSSTSHSKTSPSFRCRCYSTGWLPENTLTRLFTMCAI